MAASLLSLGVVPEGVAAQLLRRAAAMAANAKTTREFAAAMRVLTAAAKLEVDAGKASRPVVSRRSNHVHIHGAIDQPAGGVSLASISEKLGLHDLAARCRQGEFRSS